METQEMTREQLVAKIDGLTKQINGLKQMNADCKKEETDFWVSDEKFRLLFNTTPIGLLIMNLQGEIMNSNKTIQDLLGYSLDTLKNMNIGDFCADPSGPHRLSDMLDQSKRIANYETKLKHKDGTIKTVLMNADYIELNKEKVLLASILDITQNKQIQEGLIKSEKEYNLLFSNAPVGITVTDFKGGLAASNQGIQELLGYDADELKNVNARDFYCNVEERQKLLDLTSETGIVRDFETKFKRKDGTVIDVLINTDLIDFKEQHKVLLTSIRNITNLKRVEEELTKERDFTNAILDTAASLMLVLNREGVITRFNQACEKTTGYTFKEIEGQHIWDALSGNPEITRDVFDKLVAGNYPSAHENYWLAKNGMHLLISWTNTALLDNAGKVEFVIATGIDITEQRKAEIELTEANQKLVNWVGELEERTTELSQLSEMGEQLQNCQTIEEAYTLSAQYIKILFPTSQGAIYILSPLKDLAESVEMWGDPVTSDKFFMPLNCWAIRRGRSHLVDGSHPGLRCGHISGANDGQSLCVPMMTNGETIGTIYLKHAKSDPDQQKTTDKLYDEHKIQLVAAVAEHIALALSNLGLREKLRQQSIRDILTGLFNRRYMEESLERELHRAEREKNPVGVIMFDIDHFKTFNDDFGHDGGDALLHELGMFFKKNIRGGDVACRYGGEEFVAVLPAATLEETRFRAEELRRGVKELIINHLGKPLGKCTISLGVALFPDNGATRDELLKSADNALYRAKNEGRDRVVVAPAVSYS